MFSSQQNTIIYSDNNWNDVVNDYDLCKELEVVIKEQSYPKNSTASAESTGSTPWVLRVAMLIAIVSLLGNLPVQSQLTSTPNQELQKFVINNDSFATNVDLTYADEFQLENKDNLANEVIIDGIQELALPKRALETYAGEVNTNTNNSWKTYHVRSYDNLTNIFHKIGHQSALKTLKENEDIFAELKLLKKGSIVRANTSNGNLSKLILTHNGADSFVVTQDEDMQYAGAWKQDVFEIRQSRSSFTIKNGLFFDGRKSGIKNQIIEQIVKVFDWDIDFSHDIRVGDEVTAVFEEIYHDGDKVGVQHLLAAEFINKDREFRAIRYTNKDGKADYFTPQGREMKKAFIRTPIAHARVSSHFNPGRFHPKLHKIRAHEGTDFAARTGTPIMATGNGTIRSLGRKGGYGRAIEIKHREGYQTLYAHMSRYNRKLKVGDKVYQGDIIGYVGSSGLATGPHLHYEFRKNNKAMDSMRASLPHSMSLSSIDLKNFRDKAINLVFQLNVLHRFVKAKIEINSSIGG